MGLLCISGPKAVDGAVVLTEIDVVCVGIRFCCEGNKDHRSLRSLSFVFVQITLMNSWAVVCDVYFLEPQTQREGESSKEFAERVQKLIAERARLTIAPWDGYLKYYQLGDKVSSSGLADVVTSGEVGSNNNICGPSSQRYKGHLDFAMCHENG